MTNMLKFVIASALLASTGGCVLGAAAGAGAVAADEYNEAKECGDDFDPLEEVTGSEDGCN